MQRQLSNYFNQLCDAFGTRFLILLAIIQFGLKGLLYTIATQGMLPLFKASGATASSLQILGALSSSPWASKPIFGVISDFFPLFGYHKRYWMVIGCIFGTLGAMMLIIEIKSVAIVVIFFFFLHLQMAIVDLLTEGKYAELMGKNPQTGSGIVTFVSACQSGGSVVALLLIGPLADAKVFQPLFFVGLVACLSPVFLILAGWLPEERRSHTEAGMRGFWWIFCDWEGLQQHGRIIVVVLITGICGPVISALTSYVSEPVGLVACGISAIVCMAGGFYVFPPLIGKVALFQLLLSLGQISIGNAADFWYTGSPECVPGGPGFSFSYYTTFTGILAAICAFLGNFGYIKWFGSWKFRSVIFLSIFLRGLAACFDIAMINRWNILLGIPDKTFYVVGETIFENLVLLLIWIPSSTIIAKVCIPGLEAVVYAYVAGVSNLGAIISQLVGAVVFDAVGLKTTLPCNWDALPWLLLAGHIIIPTIVGIPSTFLLPDIKQTENIQQTETIRLESEVDEGLGGLANYDI